MLRSLLLLLLVAQCALAHSAAPPPPPLVGRAWIVVDVAGGQVLASERADDRVEPASLTKLMTAYLVFAALRDGKLKLEQTVAISERAWKAPGSRMFVEPRKPVTADELIRGMVIQSGNDATIALAEAAAGSEEVFAQMMNREAERLGMKSTRFANASGLPDPAHYSTARDLYLLAAALIRDFPKEYGTYYSQKEYRYNNITQPNRNRLLWLDPGVDGVKTGFTESAGWCLIASSSRNGRRVLSVLLGSTSEANRIQDSQKLLNWAFQFFDGLKLYDKGQVAKSIDIWKGTSNVVKAGLRDGLVIAVPKGETEKVKAEIVTPTPLLAPIAEGQVIGILRVTHDGKPLGEFQLVALEGVAVAGPFGRAWDTLRLWFK